MSTGRRIDFESLDWSAHADQSRWPIAEHLYLAEGARIVGAAICDPWDGREPAWAALEDCPLIPWTEDAFDGDAAVASVHVAFRPVVNNIISPAAFAELELRRDQRAWAASHVADPAGGTPLPALSLRAREGEDVGDPILPQHWTYAFMEAAERHHLSHAARTAMPPIARALAELAFQAEIETFARPFGGGAMIPLDPAIWAIDDPLPRLAACALRIDDPFNPDAVADHRIFLGEDGLRGALERLADTLFVPLVEELEGPRVRHRADIYEKMTETVTEEITRLMTNPRNAGMTKNRFLNHVLDRFGTAAGGVVFNRAWAAATEEHGGFAKAGRRLGS